MSEPTEPSAPVQEPTMPTPPPGAGQAPGDVLGDRYVLREVLGQGGMATVWRAHDPVLHRDVAIKLFSPAAAWSGADADARAAAEVRMLAGLNHPHLVSVHDASGSAAGRFDYLVMELVSGPSLRRRLDQGPLPPAEVAVLGAELAAGLEHVHRRGIVHRDLKPANILLEPTGTGEVRAKIADFGVARLLEGAALTMEGTTVGTANYVSPEQATGSTIGPPSDIYSLGLVLLECLTGVLAYPGHGVAAAAARLHRPPELPPTLPPGWAPLLTAMTAPDPAARPDAGQVVARLRALPGTGPAMADAATTALPSTADTAPSATAVFPAGAGSALPPGGTAVLAATPPPERRRRRAALVLLAVAAVVVVALLGLVIGMSGGSDDAPADSGPTAPRSTPSSSPTAAPSSRTRSTSASATRSTSRPATTSAPAPAPPGQSKKQDPGSGKDKKPGGPGGKDKGGPPGKDKP